MVADPSEPLSPSDTGVLRVVREKARQFLLATIVLTGIICGIAAVGFHELVQISTRLLIENATKIETPLRIPLVVLTPVLIAALLAVIIQRFAPGAGGANLARVRLAYHRDPGLLNRRAILATFFLTPLSLGS